MVAVYSLKSHSSEVDHPCNSPLLSDHCPTTVILKVCPFKAHDISCILFLHFLLLSVTRLLITPHSSKTPKPQTCFLPPKALLLFRTPLTSVFLTHPNMLLSFSPHFQGQYPLFLGYFIICNCSTSQTPIEMCCLNHILYPASSADYHGHLP